MLLSPLGGLVWALCSLGVSLSIGFRGIKGASAIYSTFLLTEKREQLDG